MTATSKLRVPSLNRLYLKRRSQRNSALKKVIKQWHQLEHTEWFHGTLEAWRSGTDGLCVPDNFLDLVADSVKDDESSLDVAVDRLAAANKRVHDVIDAMDRKLFSYEVPKRGVKAPCGKYDSEQVLDIVRKVTTNPNLARQAALGVLDQVGGGVKSLSSLMPENFDKVYEACRGLLAREARQPTLSRSRTLSKG